MMGGNESQHFKIILAMIIIGGIGMGVDQVLFGLRSR